MTHACAATIDQLFDADHIIQNFSRLGDLLPSVEIPTSHTASRLKRAEVLVLPATTNNWMKQQQVTSFLVLKESVLVHESYRLGTKVSDQRMSWSIAKSILSILFGILHDRGIFKTLDAEVISFVPTLSRSAYRDVTLDNLLQMTSGVTFTEDYHDPTSDIRKLAQYLGQGGGLDAYVAARRHRHARPGAVWAYSSLDTQVLGMVIAAATGQPVSELISKHLIVPLGCESAPSYLTDARGAPFVLGGITMRTRDFARFGQMVANNGMWEGNRIVSSEWLNRLQHPVAPTSDGELKYSDQWWIPADAIPGEVMACGIYGQYIYVNRIERTVCVATSANRHFSSPGVFEQALHNFRYVASMP